MAVPSSVKNLMIGAGGGPHRGGRALCDEAHEESHLHAAERGKAPIDPAHAALAEAKKLAAAGQSRSGARAHCRGRRRGNRASRRPRGARHRSAVGRRVLARADQETDIPTRRMLLSPVAQSSTVDAARRRTAADKLKEVDYLGTDIRELPKAAKEPPPRRKKRRRARAGARSDRAASPSPAPSGRRQTFARRRSLELRRQQWRCQATEPTSEVSERQTNDLALQGRDGEARASAALEPRVLVGARRPTRSGC